MGIYVIRVPDIGEGIAEVEIAGRDQGAMLGEQVAQLLLDRGAAEILGRLRDD